MIPPLVVIESPWAGLGAGERAAEYLRNCIRDSLARGEIPWASHAMLAATRALYEEDEDQRIEGLEVNKMFILHYASRVAFYTDHGLSPGMAMARRWAGMHGKIIEERKIFSEV
jgi:hypothetical protein